MKIKPLIALAAITSLSGCTLAPNTVRVEAEHMSHLSQHFGSHPTHYGAEMVGVTAQWRSHSGFFAELGEHYNVSPTTGSYKSWTDVDGTNHWQDNSMCQGGICGPREITTITVGYIFNIK